MLALMIGLLQLALGLFKLGVVVNFLSHPVIVGFTNAAAIIIGLSQLSKLLGVPMGRSEHFIQDIWGVLRQVGDTHLPTLAMGASAIALMWALRRWAPRLPGVLIVVALTTLVSWAMGFERNATGHIEQIVDRKAAALLTEHVSTTRKIERLTTQINETRAELKKLIRESGTMGHDELALDHELDLLRLQRNDLESEHRSRNRALRGLVFERVAGLDGQPDRLHLEGQVPPGERSDGARWHIAQAGQESFKLIGGGEVIGSVPQGLPVLGLPTLNWEMIGSLLSAAMVISLVGFMEAISIAKALAARTRQRINPSQELIGQGLANIAGAFSQAFPVAGSFSRSAVNIDAGARTGMASVFTGLLVLLTLLFLTPLLYHLPQAVLAAVIIMAVIGLLNVEPIRHAWKASRHDGIAAIVTFVATLGFAPHLDHGILVGTALAIGLYLYRSMTPRVAILGRHEDGTLRDAATHALPSCDLVTVMRFDGRLYFANVSYFEDAVLEAVAAKPTMRVLLMVADGINEMDASGEEVIHHLVERLRDTGITMQFSGLKSQVLDVMRATGLIDVIGERRLHATADRALQAIRAELAEQGIDAASCLLQHGTQTS
jgi:SulP family sulfate permease